MSVGNVDLASAWAVGREVANKLLATYYPDADATIDLVIFSKDKIDMLRPHGDYVGVNAVDDDERSEWLNDEAPASTLPPDDGVEELGLNIDDYFGPTPNEPEHESCANIKHTLQYEGKTYYKPSLVAGLCSNHAKKVTMRTLRARGLALEDLQKQSEYVEDLNLEKEDLLKAGDLAAVLVRNEDKLALAVIELTGFYGPANAVTQFSVDASSFFDPKSSITVLAQILELNCTETNPPASWQWTGKYLQLHDSTSKFVGRRHIVLELPSSIVFPLAPSISLRHSNKMSKQDLKYTWALEEKQLSEIMSAAYEALDPEGTEAVANVGQLPSISNPQGIPYEDNTGELVQLFVIFGYN